TGHAPVYQEQALIGQDLDDLLIEYAHALVAGLTCHLATRKHATRSHVGSDRATMSFDLMRAVRTAGSAKVMTAQYARKTTPAGNTTYTDELARLEQFIELDFGSEFVLSRIFRIAAELAGNPHWLHPSLGKLARQRLTRMLRLALAKPEHQRIIPMLFLSALANDERLCFDHSHRSDGAVCRHHLAHANFATQCSGMRIHFVTSKYGRGHAGLSGPRPSRPLLPSS